MDALMKLDTSNAPRSRNDRPARPHIALRRTATLHARTFMRLCFGLVACSALAEEQGADFAKGFVTPSLLYDGALAHVLRGGESTGSTYAGLLHLRVEAQAANTTALARTTAFVDVRTIHGGRPSDRVGDAQAVTNIAGPSGTDIEELWVQHNFGRTSVLGGIYDLNTEFYRLQAAGLFLNSSFGIGPEFSQSGVEGPSIFPRTAVGARVAFKPESRASSCARHCWTACP
jgi:porin